MSSFTDQIRLVFEAVTGQATAGVARLDRELDKAGKTTDGLKGYVNRLGGALDAIGPQALAGAAAAVAGLGIKSVKVFQDAAIAAADLADATGLTTEEASRWQEVAGDAGVSTDALASALNKMNRTAAGGGLKSVGIQAQGANEQLIAVMQYLNGIDDAGKRAAEGTRILGKGWAELAPLIADAADARKNLADVSDEQVFDAAEVARAKAIRDITDQISDSFDRAKLAAGGYFAGVIEGASDIGGMISKAADSTSLWGKAWRFGANNVKLALDPVIQLGTALPELADHLNEQEAAADKAAAAVGSLRAADRDLEDATVDVGDAVESTSKKYDELRDSMLKGRDAARDLRSAQRDATEALLIYMSKGTAPAIADTDEFAASIDKMADAALATPAGMSAALNSIDDLQRSTQKGSPAWSALEDLRKQLLNLQQPTVIAIDVDTRQAQVQLDILRRAIRDTANGVNEIPGIRASIRRNGKSVAF
jgi:hypothetical protein